MAGKCGLMGNFIKEKKVNFIRGGRVMKNIEMTTNENILLIKVDLSERYGKSSSGKSTIIASTEGNQSIPGHEEIKIGLNIYTK